MLSCVLLDKCGSVSFIPIDANGPKIFGFSEYLASLALMVLAWTIADVRYRFRIQCAPFALQRVTFWIVAAIGVLTLMTDLWRAEEWLVPKGNLLSPNMWQALLGGLLLLTFLLWTWFAFIKPPKFSTFNAKNYAQTLYRFILKGSAAELAIIADEITASMDSLVHNATDWGELQARGVMPEELKQKKLSDVEGFANELPMLLADKRLCRAIVESSPGTALAVFRAMSDTRKYGIGIAAFAKNVFGEAIANKNSFLFHETEGYQSGLIGYLKPLSKAMFSNYEMVEAVGRIFDQDFADQNAWDAEQWGAYSRAVLMTFSDYVEKGWRSHSYVLYRAMSTMEHAILDLSKLDGVEGIAWNDDRVACLGVVIDFIKNAVEILGQREVPEDVQWRVSQRDASVNRTFYDRIAQMIFNVIHATAYVTSPWSLCWWIQHNSVWVELFNFDHLKGDSARVIKFKVRRLLYDEIVYMNKFPNYKGARILRYCLTVMGLILPTSYDSDSRALHKAVLAWVRIHFVGLHNSHQLIALECLPEGMAYHADKQRIVKISPANGLRPEAKCEYFPLMSAT
ncbi:hypothetical protein [Chlorobium phaeovibrioides]|uniref:hypothetical protein n=1 Tax=Chlorobium phaeovibrioides TaxID=1094 RepID=UPI00163A071F|nr:hypothetical protein [Chlorobium phaeovibrioides]